MMLRATNYNYTEAGSGPAIVFVHGIGARRSLWDPVITTLAAQYRCVSYDLRGHGDSPVTRQPFTLDDLVDDVEVLRSQLGLEAIHLVGHSLGGMIGPRYAYRFPARTRSVSLLSTAAFRSDEDSHKVRGLVQEMRERGVTAMLDVLADRWFTDAFRSHHPERIVARKRQVVDTDEPTFLNVFDIYATTEMAPWLPEVRAPALALTGELDGGCSPRLNEQIANAIHDCELSILPRLKHAILLEAPDEVTTHLAAFLHRVESRTRGLT